MYTVNLIETQERLVQNDTNLQTQEHLYKDNIL